MAGKLATFIVIVLVLLIAGVVIYFKNPGLIGLTVQNNIASENVSKWIGTHAMVYVQAGCIHCKEQEDLFGSNWKYITSFDCASSTEHAQVCSIAGITGTPTWVINGQQYIGTQSIDTLKQLTGYPG